MCSSSTGLCDTGGLSESEALRVTEGHLTSAMSMCPYGVDCVVFVLNYANHRFTMEDSTTFNTLRTMFTEQIFHKYCVVLFTHQDVFLREQECSKNPVTFQKWCEKQGGGLKELLDLCQFRWVLFDNLRPSEEQRKELVGKIRAMKPSGDRYTNKLFQQAFADRRKLVEEAQLPSITAEVMHKLALFREDLNSVLETTDRNDKESLILKLDAIKDDADDLLEEIEDCENTSGVLDELFSTVKDFAESVDDYSSAREHLSRLDTQNSKLRTALSVAGKVTGAASLGVTVAKTVAVGATAVGVGTGVAGPVGAVVGAVGAVALIAGEVVSHFSNKKKLKKEKEANEAFKQKREEERLRRRAEKNQTGMKEI